MKKYCRAEQATHYNMAHAHCLLAIYVYKHTLGICNTYCFPLQQWLRERVWILDESYVACLIVRKEKNWGRNRSIKASSWHIVMVMMRKRTAIIMVKILGSIVQNVFASATRRWWFVRPASRETYLPPLSYLSFDALYLLHLPPNFILK